MLLCRYEADYHLLWLRFPQLVSRQFFRRQLGLGSWLDGAIGAHHSVLWGSNWALAFMVTAC